MNIIKKLCLVYFLLFSNYLLSQPLALRNDKVITFWHKELSKYLNIKEERLKLVPQFMVLDGTSFSLWNTFNATSNYSSTIYFDPSQNNQFSSDYNIVLYNYLVEPTTDKSCNINDAILKYIDAEGKYAWDKTIDNLNSELAKSDPISFNSEVNTLIDDNNSSEIIKIDLSYKHLLVFYSYPYSQLEEPFVDDYKPWFTPCILKKAYNNKEFKQWEEIFGKTGFLQYITVGFVIAKEGSTCIKVYKSSKPDSSPTFSSCVDNDESPFIIAAIVYTIDDFVNDK